MELQCGQKIVVRSPFNDNFVGGRIVSFFYLTEDDAVYFRKKCDKWAHVRAGDRAFHYDVPSAANGNLGKYSDYNPRVFIIGYDDIYLCVR